MSDGAGGRRHGAGPSSGTRSARQRGPRRGWRDADLASRGGPRPQSVSVVVRRTTLGLTGARLGEGVLLAVAGMCVTLAAAVGTGATLATTGAWVVAAVGGLSCGLAWVLEHPVREARIARSIDRRLRHGGALVTAWELEQAERRGERGALGALERLCVERVLDRLRVAEAVRALLPSLLPPVVLPLAAATVLVLTLEQTHDRQRAAVTLIPVDGLSEELQAMRSEAVRAWNEEGMGDTARKILALRGEIDTLRLALVTGDGRPDEQAVRLGDLDRRLGALGPEVARDPALRDDVERVRARLDALRRALASGAELQAGAAPSLASAEEGPEAPRGEPARGAGEGSPAAGSGEARAAAGGGSGGAAAPAAEGGQDAGGDSRGALATSGADGTMVRPAAPEAPLPVTPEQAGATAAGAWWDPADDTLVADWVEILRRAHGAARPEPAGR